MNFHDFSICNSMESGISFVYCRETECSKNPETVATENEKLFLLIEKKFLVRGRFVSGPDEKKRTVLE